MRIFPKSFFGQLILGTILVQTLFLFFFIGYTIISQRNIAEQRTRQRTVQQLNRLSAACSRELAKGDMASVHDVLELSHIAPTIEVARLTDLTGKTLAVTDNGRNHGLDTEELAVLDKATQQQQIFEIKNGQLEAVTPVTEGSKPVALLWLEPNHALSLNTANSVVHVALTYGGFALLANILPIFLLTRTVIRPLNTLRAATHRVFRNPDLNTGFPLPVTTTNEAGELTSSFNAMVRELQEQRRGLLETLALLDSMLGNAPIGFAFFDRDLRYVRVNDFLAGVHGLPVEEHLGRRSVGLYPGNIAQQKEAYVQRVFETGEGIRDVELSDGSQIGLAKRTWLMHFYPVRTGEATKWVGVIVVEVTDRLQAEEALRRTEKLAAAGRLAASIAHEINNPLEAVTNLLYLLHIHESMDDVAKHYIATAESELARVSEITQQTLRFYRQSTSPTQTSVAEVLDSVLVLHQPRITSLHVRLTKDYRGSTELFGFSGELRQLFANLVGNALDAMPKGGALTLKVRRGCGRGADGAWGEGVRVSVADTGAGMSDETRRRIFEAFFTTKEATGTGLGLWVSDEIVRKHSGTVRVKSRQGTRSGTSFMLFFPDGGLKAAEARA